MVKQTPVLSRAELRLQAERQLARLAEPKTFSKSDAMRVMHELQVHQIELQAQNEELHNLQAQLQQYASDSINAKTAELYEAQRLSRIGSWEWLPEKNLLEWSPELFRIAAVPTEAGSPQNHQLKPLFRPEGWAELCQRFKGLVSGAARQYEIELELLPRNGIHCWVIARGEAQRDRSGKQLKLRGTVQDVTEQKLAEQRNAALTQEVMDLYQNAPCGYHSLDAEGRFVRINNTELTWLGYRRDELLGRKLTDLLTPDSREQFAQSFPLLRTSGEVRDIELEMIRKDGSILPVLKNSTAVFDDAGGFVMSRAMTVDMTERKKLREERLREERRRAEVSRHLIAVQEEERRRLAQEVHDVVSPNLSAVQIILSIIEAGLPDAVLTSLGPRVKEFRDLIQDTHQRLRDVCANLRPSLLDYRGLYAAVDSYRQLFAERTGLIVELNGGEAGGRLPNNIETLLFRITQEALTNCAKYAKASRVTIELSHDSKHAYLEINDDGIGFEPDKIGLTTKEPGLGLLTMAERAEFAGGRFRIESTLGQGTRITVEI